MGRWFVEAKSLSSSGTGPACHGPSALGGSAMSLPAQASGYRWRLIRQGRMSIGRWEKVSVNC